MRNDSRENADAGHNPVTLDTADVLDPFIGFAVERTDDDTRLRLVAQWVDGRSRKWMEIYATDGAMPGRDLVRNLRLFAALIEGQINWLESL